MDAMFLLARVTRDDDPLNQGKGICRKICPMDDLTETLTRWTALGREIIEARIVTID